MAIPSFQTPGLMDGTLFGVIYTKSAGATLFAKPIVLTNSKSSNWFTEQDEFDFALTKRSQHHLKSSYSLSPWSLFQTGAILRGKVGKTTQKVENLLTFSASLSPVSTAWHSWRHTGDSVQGTRKNEFIWKFVFSFHVHRITLGPSPLRISSKTLLAEPNFVFGPEFPFNCMWCGRRYASRYTVTEPLTQLLLQCTVSRYFSTSQAAPVVCLLCSQGSVTSKKSIFLTGILGGVRK